MPVNDFLMACGKDALCQLLIVLISLTFGTFGPGVITTLRDFERTIHRLHCIFVSMIFDKLKSHRYGRENT